MNIQNILTEKINYTLNKIGIQSCSKFIKIRQTNKKKFGDYQINGLIAISKATNIPIEKITKKILNALHLHYITKKIQIEYPGFINIFLNPKWIEDQINNNFFSKRLGISLMHPKTIIIDYSGPNIAKEMHVGHLRSTVIGDSIARILSFLGHNVIRVNHIGDWGTQFGMLIAYIEKNKNHKFLFNTVISLATLENFYKKSKIEYDNNPNFAALSRHCVVKLQEGDQYYHDIWENLVKISILNNQKIYSLLNITLKTKNIMGESLYHPMIPEIVKDLKNKGLAVINNGATVVFIENTHNKIGQPFGVIIQKKDGAYLYSTTDIACIKYRCEKLQADKIIYYTDSRQKQHLSHAWEIAKKSGYTKSVIMEHHICGMLLEKNGKPFKTRSGRSLKLITLLNESIKRARYLILNKNPTLKKCDQINTLTHIIAIGAIKYSELSKNRTINYIFNWNNILNFEGNTAPYIQYAYTRIASIIRRVTYSKCHIKKDKILLKTQEEISLATCLLQFEETLILTSNHGTPHVLCAYLYKTSVLFSSFYEHCSILHTQNPRIKYSRLKLSIFTARTLKKGLNLLGIKTTEYM